MIRPVSSAMSTPPMVPNIKVQESRNLFRQNNNPNPQDTFEKSGSDVSFGSYSWLVKKAWKAGKLPQVKKGFYGDTLTMSNLTVEHLKPHSQGGPTVSSNLVLASKNKNCARGDKPIKDYVDPTNARTYLEQFRDVAMKGFKGNRYIEKIEKTLKKQGIDIDPVK